MLLVKLFSWHLLKVVLKSSKLQKKLQELIHKAEIDPLVGPQAYQARELGFKLGLNPTQMKQFVKIFMGLANMFNDFDFALLEINPLVITDEGNLHCLDGKIGVDGNALYRQPKIREMHDPSQEDAREAHAASFELNYIALNETLVVWLTVQALQWVLWTS